MTNPTDAINAYIAGNRIGSLCLSGCADAPAETRQQSASMTIAGRLTSVGERFAGIESGDQQITLSINTEQARWLGKYVGGEIKLTVEVQL